MIRKTVSLRVVIAACAALAALASSPASAQTRAGGAASANQPANQAAKLGDFGDWGAYASRNARGKICYALTKPKEQTPKTLKFGDAFLFVSTRPAENVRNEIALMMGFGLKEGQDAQAVIGDATFVLAAKGENLFVRNPAEEGRVVETMKKGDKLVIKVSSARGNATTHTFSLKGVTAAIERAERECR